MMEKVNKVWAAILFNRGTDELYGLHLFTTKKKAEAFVDDLPLIRQDKVSFCIEDFTVN